MIPFKIVIDKDTFRKQKSNSYLSDYNLFTDLQKEGFAISEPRNPKTELFDTMVISVDTEEQLDYLLKNHLKP